MTTAPSAAFLLLLSSSSLFLLASSSPLEFRLFLSDGHGLESVQLRFSKNDAGGMTGVTEMQQQQLHPPPPRLSYPGASPSVQRVYFNNGGRPIGLPEGNLSPNVYVNHPSYQPLTTYPIYIPTINPVASPTAPQDPHKGYPQDQGSSSETGARPRPTTFGAPAAPPPPPGLSASFPSSEGFGEGEGGNSFLARGRDG